MRNITIALCVLLLSSCASIVSKSQYPVIVNSEPDGADFSIYNRSGDLISKGKTPTSIVLKSGAGFFASEKYKITFKKDGFPERNINFDARLDGWYLGNILFGGLLGILIVDPATGAMWTLDNKIKVSLDTGKRLDFAPSTQENDTKGDEEEAAIKEKKPSVVILTLDQVAEEDLARMKRIN